MIWLLGRQLILYVELSVDRIALLSIWVLLSSCQLTGPITHIAA